MKRSTLMTGAAALLAAWSCSSDRNPAAPGAAPVRTEVRLTDVPPAAASLRSVNVYIDQVDASVSTDTAGRANAQPWTTLVAPHQRYDLLTLQGGTTALLGTTDLSPTQYHEIRVVLDTDSSNLVRSDGTLAPVHWGRAGQIAVHVLVEAPAAIAGPTARILIDFNVANSFVPDPQDATAFLFLPWIRAVASGS